MEAYEWPGNVRDLEHTIERLVVIGDQPEISGEDVELAINGERVSPVKETPKLQDMMDAYERKILENAAKKYKSSRKIAEVLGVSQPTILRKEAGDFYRIGPAPTLSRSDLRRLR